METKKVLKKKPLEKKTRIAFKLKEKGQTNSEKLDPLQISLPALYESNFLLNESSDKRHVIATNPEEVYVALRRLLRMLGTLKPTTAAPLIQIFIEDEHSVTFLEELIEHVGLSELFQVTSSLEDVKNFQYAFVNKQVRVRPTAYSNIKKGLGYPPIKRIKKKRVWTFLKKSYVTIVLGDYKKFGLKNIVDTLNNSNESNPGLTYIVSCDIDSIRSGHYSMINVINDYSKLQFFMNVIFTYLSPLVSDNNGSKHKIIRKNVAPIKEEEKKPVSVADKLTGIYLNTSKEGKAIIAINKLDQNAKIVNGKSTASNSKKTNVTSAKSKTINTNPTVKEQSKTSTREHNFKKPSKDVEKVKIADKRRDSAKSAEKPTGTQLKPVSITPSTASTKTTAADSSLAKKFAELGLTKLADAKKSASDNNNPVKKLPNVAKGDQELAKKFAELGLTKLADVKNKPSDNKDDNKK